MNHIEKNVFKALNDVPTLTELAVLCLYSQTVSAPFVEFVRNPQPEFQNALDLAPFYDRIISCLEPLIKNPNVLLGPNVSLETCTFNGQPLKNPEAVNLVRNNQHLYPHLQPLLIAFASGALKTWKRFIGDIGPGSKISELTPEERYLAFRLPTNEVSWKGAANLDVQEGHIAGAPSSEPAINPNQDVLEGGGQPGCPGRS